MRNLIIGVMLLIPALSFADCSIPEAIEYQWGPVADTVNGKITGWRHPTDPQPNDAQVEAIRVGPCSKEKLRAEKIAELWDEAQRRVQVYLPGVNLISMYHVWVSIDNKTPDAAMTAAISHYAPWKAARDTLDNFTGVWSINTFDAITGLP